MMRSHGPFPRHCIPLLALLLTALALRLIGLPGRSLFNDELSALFRLQSDTFHALMDHGVRPDYHPAGIQVFLFYWTSWVGDNPFWLRLPFALAGTGSVWLVWLLGRRWFGTATAWFAACSLALLQLPLLYSQLARPYSTGLLFILAAAWFWDKVLFSTRKGSRSGWWYAAGLTVSFALAMYNHYFSFFMAALIGLTGLFFLRKSTFMPYLLSGLGATLLFLPHLSISIEQLSRGGLSTWLPPPDKHWLAEHAATLFNGSWWLMAFILLIPILLLIKPPGNRMQGTPRKPGLIAFSWYIIPLTFACLYSILVNPILQHSIMLFAMPFLLMAIFSGFRDDATHFTQLLKAIFPVILIIHLFAGARYYTSDHYADVKTTPSDISSAIHHNPSTAWCVEVNHPWYIHHYLDPQCRPGHPLFYSALDEKSLDALRQQLDTLASERVIYAWLKPSHPMVPSMIRQFFPHLAGYRSYGMAGEVFLFSRKPPDSSPGSYLKDTITLARWKTPTAPDSIPTVDEYLPIFEGPFPVKRQGGGNLLHCIVTGAPDSTLQQVQLVSNSTGHNGKPKTWNGLPLRAYNFFNGAYVFTFQLPAHWNSHDRLKVYLWNPGREKFRCHSFHLMLIGEQIQE